MKRSGLVKLMSMILGIWIVSGAYFGVPFAEAGEEDYFIDEEQGSGEEEGDYFEIPGKGAVTRVNDDISLELIKSGMDAGSGLHTASYTAQSEAVSSNFPYAHTESENIAAYFTERYPVNRNQNPYGSCWAHSAMALSEFYMINHGLTDSGTDIDLSELHTVYYCYRQGTPSIAGDTGDTISYTGSQGIVDCGGNLDFASQTLMNGRGAVSEDMLPYTYATQMNSGLYAPEGIEYSSVVRLKNAMEINIDNKGVIKQFIRENGAVGVSFFATNAYYNSEHNCYYGNSNVNTNHAVCLVGWDDDFPREYFKPVSDTLPENNGAWLVRNSWNFGDEVLSYNNYFWISYEDTSLSMPNGSAQKSAWVFEIVKPEDIPANNYFYTSQIHSKSYITVPYSANVYKACSGADYEEIKAVSFDAFGLSEDGTGIEISVYKSVDPKKGPSSGKKIENATTSAMIYLDGKYTIDLKESVIVKAGESFAVVIKRNDNKSIVYERAYSRSNGIAYEVGCGAGQSYYSDDGMQWKDILNSSATSKRSNFVINALTSDYYGPIPDPGPDPVTDISAFCSVPDMSGDALFMVKGQSFTLQDKGWQIENKNILRYSGGVLTAKKAGRTVLKNMSGQEYEVCVSEPHFSKKSYLMNEGDSLKADDLFFVCIDGSDVRESYQVYYYSSDPNVVKLEDGVITANMEGRATVYAVISSKVVKTNIRVQKIEKQVTLKSKVDEIELSPLQSIKLSLPGYSFRNASWTSDRDMKPYKEGKAYADSVVYISRFGKMTAIGVGETNLVCSNGVKISVTVAEPQEKEIYLNLGQSRKIKIPGVKKNSAEWNIEENNGVLKLWANGKIKTVGRGECVIKCSYSPYKVEGAGFDFVFRVYSECPLLQTDAALHREKDFDYVLNIKEGEEIKLDIDADNGVLYQPLVFKSSDPLKVYADEEGNVHALKAGKAKIVSKINGKKVRIKVKITEAEQG